jgi:serine/threonine-protein kinase
MGVVYKARQLALNRVVALKMVLAGSHAGPEAVARFRAEAEAVARLQHPNIVQVHEVGEAGGLPFFSLEFVEGGGLDRMLAGTPLPAGAAARMIEVLARAVHAAHERGVVHRDLKPANVLLTADGTPKIADFGLAKRLDGEAGPTRTGAVMGTPSYMAPEQAGAPGAVGPATDVYALGAILYEMLTGRPPFKAATALDTVLQVVSEEPVPPSRLQPKVPRDLETVCLTCLRKDPARRYARALDLAEDLRRFQAGEPILARPTSWWERAVKWARRRPATAGLLAVSAAAVVALAAVGLTYQARLRRSNAELSAALEKADQEHERAQAHLHKALEAVDRMLTQVGDERLARAPQLAGLRRQLLEEALDFYRGFLRQESDDPAVRRETARAYFRIATLHFGLGRSEQAERACRDAVALQEKLVADFPAEPEYQHDLAASHGYLGHVYATTGRFALAAQAYTKALENHERLARQLPERAEYRESLASGHNSLGYFNSFINAPVAEKHFRAAVAVAERLARERPGSARHQCLLASCHTNLGVQLVNSGRAREAEEALGRGRALLHPDGGNPPSAWQDYPAIAAKNEVWRGVLYAQTKRDEQAEATLKQGIATYERLLQETPDHFTHRNELVRAYATLAEVYDRLGRDALAAETWRTGIDWAERMVKDYPAFFWVSGTADRMRVRALEGPARRGRVKGLAEQARALAAKKGLPGDLCYDLACIYALVAAAEERARAEERALAAIELLARAADAGFFRSRGAVEHAWKDDDLRSLREREDFRALLGKAAEQLKKATARPPGP